MIDDDESGGFNDDDPAWGRRRQHLRHEVDVRALIQGELGFSLDCRICDISSTGMLLNYDFLVPEGGRDPLRIGSDVQLRFAPDPQHSPDYFVVLDVQVMWKTPHGIGVRFLGIDQEQLDALRSVATAAVALRQEEEAARTARGLGGFNKSKIMHDSRKTMERHLPNMIWTMRTGVQRILRHIAETDAEQKDAALADLDVIEAKANAIGRSVERQLVLAVAEMSGLDDTQELVFTHLQSKVVAAATGRDGADDESMNMMDQEEVASSAALATSIAYIEDQLKSRLFELNVRLANVLEHKLDIETNPILPARVCRTLWQSLTEHVDNGRIQRALREVFKVQMLPLLSDLYGDLHKTLDAHHVPGAFRKTDGAS